MKNLFNVAARRFLTRCAIVVFGLTAAAGGAGASTFQTIHFFGNGGVGGSSSLTVGPDGTLYGTVQANPFGNVFALTPPKSGQTAWTASNIWTFSGSSSGPPGGGVIMGSGGNIYGVTGPGSAANDGGVYALVRSPAGSNTWRGVTFYNFPANGKNGEVPLYDLVQGKNGEFYGVTFRGGSTSNGNAGTGDGAVFKLIPPAAGKTTWAGQVLFSFGAFSTTQGYPTGTAPNGPLLMDSLGALYGVTYTGGIGSSRGNFGLVYKLTPPGSGSGPWTEAVLYAFNGDTDGAYPIGRLAMDSNGVIYGAAEMGGSTYQINSHTAITTGAVFKLTPPPAGQTKWTESTAYVFGGLADGLQPSAGLIMDKSGALYGVTSRGGVRADGNCANGCGVVFKLTPPKTGQTKWTETVLHAFTDGLDGRLPSVDLAMDATGSIYGTTDAGGSGIRGQTGANGYGTAFKIVP